MSGALFAYPRVVLITEIGNDQSQSVQSWTSSGLYSRGAYLQLKLSLTRGGPTCVHESLQVQCIDVIAVT